MFLKPLDFNDIYATITMKATKIIHKKEARIKIEFPYNNQTICLLKQIEGSKWSQTHNAWHIPYDKEAFKQLIQLFPEVEYDKKQAEIILPQQENLVEAISFPDRNGIYVDVIGRRIILKLPKNESDTRFIQALKYSKWDSKQFCWIIPHFPGNLELIQDFFKERISRLNLHETQEISNKGESYKVTKNEFLCIRTNHGRLKLVFGFNKEVTYKIKTLPYHFWDAKNKWWTIPYSDLFLNTIKEVVESEKMQWKYIEETTDESTKKPRLSPYDIPNYRYIPEEYILKLRELRYSEKTIKTYRNGFEEFINYYNNLGIDKIDETQIIAFLRYLVIERKVSSSYQNQAINAIKFYYERVLGGQRKFYFYRKTTT